MPNDAGPHWWFLLFPVLAALISLLSAVVSTFLVYRFTHRHSLRSNAERWLDCVREDVAEFVSLHWTLCTLQAETILSEEPASDSKGKSELLKQTNEWRKQRHASLVRLRLRLTRIEAQGESSLHKALLQATDKLARTDYSCELDGTQDEVLEAACNLVRDEWTYIKTGRRPSEAAEPTDHYL